MRHSRSLLLAVLAATACAGAAAPDRVTLPFGQKVFVSGINVAWKSFSGDVGSQPLDTAWFAKMLTEVADSGGNAVRWWLFTNCANAPTFDKTTKLADGPGSATIANVRTLLDMAYKRGIVVSLCLLSFDMMKANQGSDTLANQKLLLTAEGRKAFLDNALVPLVTAIGRHPAILDWEVFNEPEGMVTSIAGDWGGMSAKGVVQISDVQRMVNLAAGAIHRAVPGVLVSNGSWAFIASSNTLPGHHNHYSDSALKAVGGDADGTLDFYMVHYYEWGGRAISPFHHRASYWGLDKPVVIGEFPAKGLSDSLGPVSPAQAFQRLYDSGYAGAMGWTYTAHDGFGGAPENGRGTRFLKTNHPLDVSLDFPPTAIDDWYPVTAGKPMSVPPPGVLLNDLEPTAGQVVSVGSVVVLPSSGTSTVAATGALTYTPDPGFVGTDSFAVEVVGGGGALDTSWVRLRVLAPSAWNQAYPRAKDWTVYASWGTISVTDSGMVLAVRNAQWGALGEWLVGTGAPVQVEAKPISIRVEVLNDAGSPWSDLRFHLAQPAKVTKPYGPSDTLADTVTLALVGSAGAGWQTYEGKLTPSAAGSYLPAFELVWRDTDGNGPNSNHVTLVRDIEIMAVSASGVAVAPHAWGKARIVGRELVLGSSPAAREVAVLDLSGRILSSLPVDGATTSLALPASRAMRVVRVRTSGESEQRLLVAPSGR